MFAQVRDPPVADQLVTMSAATIDRKLATDRAELTTRRGRSLTKPGSMLKSHIPMRTWADWDDKRPGFLEVDLVGHDGGDLNGQFCFTLTCTDIATGWTENRTVRNKAAKWVFAALVEIQAQFPFRVLRIDSEASASRRLAASGRERSSWLPYRAPADSAGLRPRTREPPSLPGPWRARY